MKNIRNGDLLAAAIIVFHCVVEKHRFFNLAIHVLDYGKRFDPNLEPILLNLFFDEGIKCINYMHSFKDEDLLKYHFFNNLLKSLLNP